MGGWKYNTIVYQREGWLSDFPRMSVGEDDEIDVWFSSRKIMQGWNMHATSGDECFFFRLRSRDKGLTWELVSKELSAKAENISRTLNASRLPDGTLVYLSTGVDFAPMDQAEVLKKKTFILENAGPGLLAYYSRVRCYRSTDDGETWEARDVSEIEPYYMIQCWGGAKGTGWVLLEDGTLMGTMVGPVSYDNPQYLSYILSSLDNGKTWRKILVPQTEDQARDNDECDLIRLTSGRILLAARNQVQPVDIQVAWSDDNGTTWRPFHPTPMRGYPPHLLELKDGRVLCTYGRRFRPFGIRACMSSDGGETWDAGNEIVIEDNGQETYLLSGGLGYPMSAQLSDGTIVTLYYNTKPTEVEGEYVAKGWKPGPDIDYAFCSVTYIGLARFTPDYVRPVGLERGDAPALPATSKEVAPDQEEIYKATDM